MRFYHIITLAVAMICLLGDRGLGAPGEGRYMWLKCNPDDKNANCLKQMGPVVPLSGQSSRLPPSAAKQIFPVSTEEATPEMEEQSGEGSGNSDAFAPFIMDQKPIKHARSTEQEVNQIEEEGSTEFSGYFVPPLKKASLSEEILKEEDIIA